MKPAMIQIEVADELDAQLVREVFERRNDIPRSRTGDDTVRCAGVMHILNAALQKENEQINPAQVCAIMMNVAEASKRGDAAAAAADRASMPSGS